MATWTRPATSVSVESRGHPQACFAIASARWRCMVGRIRCTAFAVGALVVVACSSGGSTGGGVDSGLGGTGATGAVGGAGSGGTQPLFCDGIGKWCSEDAECCPGDPAVHGACVYTGFGKRCTVKCASNEECFDGCCYNGACAPKQDFNGKWSTICDSNDCAVPGTVSTPENCTCCPGASCVDIDGSGQAAYCAADCTADAQCEGGYCSGSRCMPWKKCPNIGQPCKADSECCVGDPAGGGCVFTGWGSQCFLKCKQDDECDSGCCFWNHCRPKSADGTTLCNTNGTCQAAGQVCGADAPLNEPCCEGLRCTLWSGQGKYVCAALCTTDSDCPAGCCASAINTMACAPLALCN